MNRTRNLLFLVLMAPSAAAPGCAAAADNEAPEEEPPAAPEQPVPGGSIAAAYPEAVLIDVKAGSAITARCSGTLIAPRAVITAAQCMISFDGFRVIAPYAGRQAASAVRAMTYDQGSIGRAERPQHDVGLIFLDTPIELAVYPTIARAPAGAKVLNVGRVRDGYASSTDLFVGRPVSVASALNRGFPFDYITTDPMEPGDAGGPSVLPGPAPHRIVAVRAGAGSGLDLLARVDLIAGWIRAQVALHGGVARSHDGCNGVTFAGECREDAVLFCDGGLRAIDCAAQGLSCRWDQGLATCL